MATRYSGSVGNYHRGLLTVRLKPAAEMAESLWGARLTGRAIQALTHLERAGLLRSVERLDADEGANESVSRTARGGTQAMFLERTDAAIFADDPLANLTMIEIDESQPLEPLMLELANDPVVERVSRVPIRHLIGDPPAAGSQDAIRTWWNLAKIGWREARAAAHFVEADQINVAILDTGIDAHHPDLAGRVHGYWRMGGVSDQDIVGHGTHVAGTIAAGIGNGAGIDGVCACRLWTYKVFDDQPAYYEEKRRFEYLVSPKAYLKALRQCTFDDVRVINLSLAGYERDPEEEQVIRQLIGANRVIVAGMGNDRNGANREAYPAAFDGVIAVGATSADDRCIQSSSYGRHIALCAPGDAIWSTLPTYPGQRYFDAVFDGPQQPRRGAPDNRPTGYHFWRGTSMAAAHVSGAVALLLASKPGLSPDAVRRRLIDTAEKVPEMSNASFTPEHGAGRLALAALLA